MSAKMYALVEDNIEKYYTIAEEKVGECEHMKEHKDLLNGSDENYEEGLDMLWNEYWSKYL